MEASKWIYDFKKPPLQKLKEWKGPLVSTLTKARRDMGKSQTSCGLDFHLFCSSYGKDLRITGTRCWENIERSLEWEGMAKKCLQKKRNCEAFYQM